jgi:hypothetical protein
MIELISGVTYLSSLLDDIEVDNAVSEGKVPQVPMVTARHKSHQCEDKVQNYLRQHGIRSRLTYQSMFVGWGPGTAVEKKIVSHRVGCRGVTICGLSAVQVPRSLPASYEKLVSFFCCCQLIGNTPVREARVSSGGCRPSMTASTISGARKATRRMDFMYRGSSPAASASARWCLHSPDSILRTQSLARLTALIRD